MGRLLNNALQPLPLVEGILKEGLAQAELVSLSGLSGRKALLHGWRQEAERALILLDNQRAETWRLRVSVAEVP